MFTLAHISSLGLRYWFLLWCGFNLYAKLVIGWDVVGILELACTCWMFTSKQKDSLLEVNSSDWPYMESPCVYTSSACSWCAFGSKSTCFLKHKLVKCPYLWQDLHWYFLAGYLKSSTCLESPHLEDLSLLVWACLGSDFLLYGGTCFCSLVYCLWLGGLDLKALFMFAWWEVCTLVPH